MKIAISAQGNTLDSAVDPRFGRCPYFFVVDTVSGETQILANDANSFASGAGIKSATSVVDQGVQAVLTGQVGPKASHVLQTAKIRVYENVSGTIANAIEHFKNEGLD